MKLSQLVSLRPSLLRQARLANLAYAHETLRAFAARIARAGLRGTVCLKPVDPDAERFCALLATEAFAASRIEEHFTDEDLQLLADVLAFVTGTAPDEFTFEIDRVADEFLPAIRAELEHAGVAFDEVAPRIGETRRA
jgi:predicted unusual protein kinase regulating ubiquinone biosynthesis (AarF/ABC1/UbiB family)